MDLHQTPQWTRLGPLWDEHYEAPFPAAVDTSEDEGIDLVMLDSNIAGVLSTVIACRRPPDPQQQKALRQYVRALDRTWIAEDALPYFLRLRSLVTLVLESATKSR